MHVFKIQTVFAFFYPCFIGLRSIQYGGAIIVYYSIRRYEQASVNRGNGNWKRKAEKGNGCHCKVSLL